MGRGSVEKPGMRVLLISHTCQSRHEGQPKAECLAAYPDVDLMVLAPERFNHFGPWREAEQPLARSFRFESHRVALPWLGPAQNYLHWYPRLRRVLAEFKPDIIDLWQEPWAAVSAHCCWLRNRLLPHAKIVMESEQNLFKRFPPPFSWFERYTMRNADCAVGRSSGVLEVLRAKGFTGPAHRVGNAVDTSLFRPMDRSRCRQELGLEGFVAGYVGRLVERKGLTDLVNALPHCPQHVNLVFAGDGEHRSAIETRANILGVGTRVRFLGARRLENLPQVMNALDALVLPSRSVPTWMEQFGRVIIEAQACETPVIGSDSGAIPEVVGRGGLIFKERDARSLASAITRCAENVEWMRELGRVGRQQVLKNFTWQRVAAQMHEIYRTCVSSGIRRGASLEIAAGGDDSRALQVLQEAPHKTPLNLP
jgi:glycosyltransferase involved in cell wall biosynthesis